MIDFDSAIATVVVDAASGSKAQGARVDIKLVEGARVGDAQAIADKLEEQGAVDVKHSEESGVVTVYAGKHSPKDLLKTLDLSKIKISYTGHAA